MFKRWTLYIRNYRLQGTLAEVLLDFMAHLLFVFRIECDLNAAVAVIQLRIGFDDGS